MKMKSEKLGSSKFLNLLLKLKGSESFIIYHSDPYSWCSDPNLVELH